MGLYMFIYHVIIFKDKERGHVFSSKAGGNYPDT